MITLLTPVVSPIVLRTSPAKVAVVSWSAFEQTYALDLRAHFTDGTVSEWLPYASSADGARRSYSASGERVRIDVDVLTATHAFRAIEVRFVGEFDALALATPEHARHPLTVSTREPIELEVPLRSQYLPEYPDKRGWCSPTSLAMLLAYHRVADEAVPHLAARVFDTAYDGTGNWTFNLAHAGGLGLRGAVVYLRDFAHARSFLDAGLPLALSYRWQANELPGAPLERSAGHIAVLRGFDANDDPILNDPAQPAVRVVYPRAALEAVWLRGGGVAYAVAPRTRTSELVALANA